MTSWATNNKHVFVTGDTGAGKSCLCSQIHGQSSRHSIYWEPIASNDHEGVDVSTVEELAAAWKQGKRKVVFRPHYDEEEAREQFEQVVGLLFRLAEKTPNTEYQIITDECHQVAPKGSTGSPLVRLVKEGRNYGIKSVGASQEPQLVAHSVLRQSRRHIYMGQPNQYHSDYLENYNIPEDVLMENGEHGGTVLDEQMNPIGNPPFHVHPDYR